MTQAITVVPVDARTPDWPRKVAQVLNRLQNTTALAGASAAWGSITGTLSAQTDLQAALNAKGTVSSVAASVPTGFTITGSPITTTGTLAISYSAGYSLPTDAVQANWTTAFGWGDHAAAGYLTTAAAAAAYQPLDTQLTSLAGLSYASNALKVVRVNAGETAFELATVAGGGGLVDGDYGDITVGGSGTTLTIDNDAVTYAKMQNVSATSRILGRKTASAGDTEECTLSEVLDFVGSPAQGDILYRGAATWARLGAGTTGQALTTRGSGANPVWSYPDVGPGWTYCTFGSSSSRYGKTIYASAETFTLAAGQRLEIEGLVYKTQGGNASLGAGTATEAYYMTLQGDDNNVLYRYNGGAETSLSASGTNTSYDYTGCFDIKCIVNVHAASDNYVYGRFNDQRQPATLNIRNTTFTFVTTVDVWVVTNDINKCWARARVVG